VLRLEPQSSSLSPEWLTDLGCRYVILGHSERRQYFGETDLHVNRKLKAALEVGLVPIVCVGETLAEREAGRTIHVVDGQLQGGLSGVPPDAGAGIALAYEPVWAIGTGHAATQEQAEEVHTFIRTRVMELWGRTVAAAVRIVYGGSVKPDNIDALMAGSDIDGALVGGASLKADAFARIVQFKKV
jgi:triosephosphate isomerase